MNLIFRSSRDMVRLMSHCTRHLMTLLLIALCISNGSTIRECDFVSEGDKMCGGKPYYEQVVSTPGFCEKYRCQTDAACKGFSFFASENKCSLFADCSMDTLVDCLTDETCITGLCYDLDFQF